MQSGDRAGDLGADEDDDVLNTTRLDSSANDSSGSSDSEDVDEESVSDDSGSTDESEEEEEDDSGSTDESEEEEEDTAGDRQAVEQDHPEGASAAQVEAAVPMAEVCVAQPPPGEQGSRGRSYRTRVRETERPSNRSDSGHQAQRLMEALTFAHSVQQSNPQTPTDGDGSLRRMNTHARVHAGDGVFQEALCATVPVERGDVVEGVLKLLDGLTQTYRDELNAVSDEKERQDTEESLPSKSTEDETDQSKEPDNTAQGQEFWTAPETLSIARQTTAARFRKKDDHRQEGTKDARENKKRPCKIGGKTPGPGGGPCKKVDKKVKMIKSLPAEIRCCLAVGQEVWAAERNGRVSVRNARTGEVQTYLQEDGSIDFFVWCMALTPRHVWMGTESGPIRVYERATRRFKQELRGHVGGVYCLTSDFASLRMFSGSNDFTIYEWDTNLLESGPLRMLAGHSNGVRCALCLGQHLWSGSDDFTVKIWDLLTGECSETLTGHTDSVTSLMCTDEHMWSSSADQTIRVWSLFSASAGAQRQCVKVIRPDTGRVGALVSMGGAFWASTGPSVSVFDPKSQQLSHALTPQHQGFINHIVKVRQTETRVLWSFSLSDRTVKIWLKETADDHDFRQLAHELSAAERSLRMQLQEQHLKTEKLRASQHELQQALLSQLESTLATLAQSELEVSRRRASQSELHQETRELQRQLEAVAAERDSYKIGENQAKEEVCKLNARLECELERERLQQAATMAEVERLQKALAQANQDKDTLQRQVVQLSDRASISACDFAAMQRRMEELDASRSAATRQVQTLQDRVALLEKDKVCLEREQERLAADLQCANTRLSERERELESAQSQIQDVTHAMDAAREREQTMAKQLLSLDIFKLDIISRELKEAEDILSFASKAVSEPGVKGQVSRCKEIVRNIINTCLSETQKLHIGTTVQGHDSSLLLDILAALRHLHPGGKPHGLASATPSTSHPSEPAASTRT